MPKFRPRGLLGPHQAGADRFAAQRQRFALVDVDVVGPPPVADVSGYVVGPRIRGLEVD